MFGLCIIGLSSYNTCCLLLVVYAFTSLSLQKIPAGVGQIRVSLLFFSSGTNFSELKVFEYEYEYNLIVGLTFWS